MVLHCICILIKGPCLHPQSGKKGVIFYQSMQRERHRTIPKVAAERVNQTLINSLINSLKSSAHSDPTNWDNYLPHVLLAYRSSCHRSTGYTLSIMLMGNELQLPADIVLGLPERSSPASVSQFVTSLVTRLHIVHQQVRERDKMAHKIQKDWYDTKSSATMRWVHMFGFWIAQLR